MSESHDRESSQPTRRAFLQTTAAGAAAISIGSAATSAGCSSVPEVEFPAGSPQDVPVGERKFLEDESVFLVHSEEGYAAISAICTHLSCVVDPVEGDGFSCGCHGSEFAADGAVTEGPAEDPLAWYAVRVEGDTIYVDGGKQVERGTWVKA